MSLYTVNLSKYAQLILYYYYSPCPHSVGIDTLYPFLVSIAHCLPKRYRRAPINEAWVRPKPMPMLSDQDKSFFCCTWQRGDKITKQSSPEMIYGCIDSRVASGEIFN